MVFRFYRTLQHLSLDIVCGAVILLRFFSYTYKVQLNAAVFFLLASAVWIIYTADRLNDAKKALNPERIRYQFHLKHEKTLKTFMLVVLFFSITASIYVPFQVVKAGAVLTVLSILYIFSQAKLAKAGFKELYIAVLYTAGIMVAPASLSGVVNWQVTLMLLFISFLNLIIFSWMEAEHDKVDNFESIATRFGPNRTKFLIFVVLAVSIVGSLSMVKGRMLMNEGVFFLMTSLIYGFLMVFPQWSAKNERYRSIADGVFLLPLVFEWL